MSQIGGGETGRLSSAAISLLVPTFFKDIRLLKGDVVDVGAVNRGWIGEDRPLGPGAAHGKGTGRYC
jgi:hypothetical protein